MSGLSYSRADASDAPVVFSLCKDLIDQYEDTAAIDYNAVIQWVRNKIEANISNYTCVRDGDKKLAYYCLTLQPEGWELDDLYVLAPYRGKGIGSRILRKCVSDAKGSLYLYVFKKNIGAIRLYEKFGFTVEKSVGTTRLIMRRNG